MSLRRVVPSQTLGELQPPAGLESLRETARTLFIECARQEEPEIDEKLLALCPPDKPGVEPAVLAQWAQQFNLNVDWFLQRAANVLETRWETKPPLRIEELLTLWAACLPRYGDELWLDETNWLDAAWRLSVQPLSPVAGAMPKIRRLPSGEQRVYWPKPKPAPAPWPLSVELEPWRWPQAWDSDPTSPSYKDSTSYKAYVYRVIEPKLAAYRAKVLEQLYADGYERPPEFDNREAFTWLARRVVHRESAPAIANDLPSGDKHHRSGIDAQTVKLARYLKLKIPRSVRPTSR